MKTLRLIAGMVLTWMLIAFVPASRADGTNAVETAKPTPYPLKTCPVSGDKLGEMGKPDTFVYQGQEIKLCCPSCKEDFDKDPAKFLKKIKEAEAAAKK